MIEEDADVRKEYESLSALDQAFARDTAQKIAAVSLSAASAGTDLSQLATEVFAFSTMLAYMFREDS